MMDVAYSDNIINTIKYLRNDIYDKEEFKTEFSNQLRNTIDINNISYTPDQFGGWIVNIFTNPNNIEYKDYLRLISDSLINTISNLNIDSNKYKYAANNLANVILAGPQSLIVKL